jgi:superfamily II DNA or RNA helicase
MTGRWGNGSRQERLDAAQWQGVNTWRSRPFMGNGTLEWHTGVGKTHSIVKAYTPFREKFPAYIEENNIIVLVPTLKLKDDWIKEGGHIDKYGFENISVYVINSYITCYHNCKWLIIDEVHRVLGTDAEFFNKAIEFTRCAFRLGLSATLTYEEKQILKAKNMPVCHTISEFESKVEGFTSDYLEYNIAVPLNHIEREEYDKFSSLFEQNKRFFLVQDQFDLKLAYSAAKNIAVCHQIAKFRGWNADMGMEDENAPPKIKENANKCLMGMSKRKEIIYNAKGKLNITEQIINKFPNKLIMTFSMSSEMADAITFRIGSKARSYHTKIKGEVRDVQGSLFDTTTKKKRIGVDKIKKETLELFAKREITVMNTVRALDEGYDLPVIDMSIITCGASSNRQQKQRKGRSTRYNSADVNKKSIIVNLYAPDTQDERWLKERQKDSRGVRWITTIELIEDESIESADFDITSKGEDWSEY